MAYYKYTNTIDVPGTVTTEDDFLAWLQAEVGDTVYNEAETAVTEEREEATCVYYNRAIADGKVTATKVSTVRHIPSKPDLLHLSNKSSVIDLSLCT